MVVLGSTLIVLIFYRFYEPKPSVSTEKIALKRLVLFDKKFTLSSFGIALLGLGLGYVDKWLAISRLTLEEIGEFGVLLLLISLLTRLSLPIFNVVMSWLMEDSNETENQKVLNTYLGIVIVVSMLYYTTLTNYGILITSYFIPDTTYINEGVIQLAAASSVFTFLSYYTYAIRINEKYLRSNLIVNLLILSVIITIYLSISINLYNITKVMFIGALLELTINGILSTLKFKYISRQFFLLLILSSIIVFRSWNYLF